MCTIVLSVTNSNTQILAPCVAPWDYGTIAHVIPNLCRHSSHPGRFPLLAASSPRWHPNHINLGASHLHRGQISWANQSRFSRRGRGTSGAQQRRDSLPGIINVFHGLFHLGWSRSQNGDDVKVGGFVWLDWGGYMLRCWMSSVGCRSTSRDRCGAAAERGRGRRTTRQRAHSSSRPTWTSSGATSITTTWCTNPSRSCSDVTRTRPTSRAGWWTTGRCPRTSRSRRPTRPRSSGRPQRRTTPDLKGSRPGWGRGGRRGRRRSAGGRRASTQPLPSWGSVSPTCPRTRNCLKLKLYAWRPVTSPTWWTSWPKTPGRRRALRPRLRNLRTGIWKENESR